MSSSIFERVCELIEAHTDMNRLEARGTVRLALRNSGLDSRRLTPSQIRVVLSAVLPAELETRGIEGAAALCESIAATVKDVGDEGAQEAGDRVDGLFRRTL